MKSRSTRRYGLEALEPRLLLSLGMIGHHGAGDFLRDIWSHVRDGHLFPEGRDFTPPQAEFSAADVTAETAAAHELTVEYADDDAVDVSDLDGRDLWVMGPHFFRGRVEFVGVDDNSDGTPRTATYELTAPGGTWDAADNGTYRVFMKPFQVSDTSNNFVFPGILGSFTVDIEPAPDEEVPEAQLETSDVTVAGGSRHLLKVKYTDNVAVDVSDLDDFDLRVTGPDGFDQPAVLVHANINRDGTPRWGYYRIGAPGGTWDSADNGTYTVMMQADEVSDTSENHVAAGDLGAFEVNVGDPPDRTPPQASLTVGDISTQGSVPHTLTVEYTDNVAVDISDLDNRDIYVLGPRFSRGHVTFVGVDADADGTPVTASYELAPRDGTWDAADNGTYRVFMRPLAVSDTNDNFVRPALLGSFSVDIESTGDPAGHFRWFDTFRPSENHRENHLGTVLHRAVDYLFRLGVFG